MEVSKRISPCLLVWVNESGVVRVCVCVNSMKRCLLLVVLLILTLLLQPKLCGGCSVVVVLVVYIAVAEAAMQIV